MAGLEGNSQGNLRRNWGAEYLVKQSHFPKDQLKKHVVLVLSGQLHHNSSYGTSGDTV